AVTGLSFLPPSPPVLPGVPTRRSSDLSPTSDRRRPPAARRRRAGVSRSSGAFSAREPLDQFPLQTEHLTLLLGLCVVEAEQVQQDRKSTRLNSSHVKTSYAVFCSEKKK